MSNSHNFDILKAEKVVGESSEREEEEAVEVVWLCRRREEDVILGR